MREGVVPAHSPPPTRLELSGTVLHHLGKRGEELGLPHNLLVPGCGRTGWACLLFLNTATEQREPLGRGKDHRGSFFPGSGGLA